jgi:hypothetical protein
MMYSTSTVTYFFAPVTDRYGPPSVNKHLAAVFFPVSFSNIHVHIIRIALSYCCRCPENVRRLFPVTTDVISAGVTGQILNFSGRLILLGVALLHGSLASPVDARASFGMLHVLVFLYSRRARPISIYGPIRLLPAR